MPIRELSALARSRGLYAIDDIGSGAIGPGMPPVASGEPTAREGIAAGADLVLFSGDKLLGGPQCGILVGKQHAIAKIEADPLMRGMRADKMTLAALEATLRLVLDPELAAKRIPLWRMMTCPMEELRARADALVPDFRSRAGLMCEAIEDQAYLGGGSMPARAIASVSVCIGPPWPASVDSEGDLGRRLRLATPSVVARVQSGSVWLDLRSVLAEDDARLADAVVRAVAAGPVRR